jgi:cysteinyl-tRNA synthetase
MCKAILGEHFDIHGGGQDLQFPHHENEIAQSEGASGRPFVNVWMHNGLLNTDNEKMSKSLGNFFTIRDVLKRFDGETIRFFMIRTHYRSAVSFSDANLDDARSALRRLYTALDAVELDAPAVVDWSDGRAAAFRAAMNDDFNTPIAVAVLFELAAEVNRSKSTTDAALLKGLGATLGVLQQAPRAFLQAGASLDESRIAALIEERRAAKARGDYARSDAIRSDLAGQGVVLKDTAQGTTWVKG